jgi:hypothetical protein
MTALSTTTGEKSRAKQVTARLKVAMDAMAHEGLQMDEAAKRAELTTSAVRKALTRPHVLAYLAEQRKIVRAAEEPRTFKRMVSILHSDRNLAASVAAGRVLMNAPDDGPAYGAGVAQKPGIVIVIQNAPTDMPLGPTIDITPSGERE